jgi:hypothetical protein
MVTDSCAGSSTRTRRGLVSAAPVTRASRDPGCPCAPRPIRSHRARGSRPCGRHSKPEQRERTARLPRRRTGTAIPTATASEARYGARRRSSTRRDPKRISDVNEPGPESASPAPVLRSSTPRCSCSLSPRTPSTRRSPNGTDRPGQPARYALPGPGRSGLPPRGPKQPRHHQKYSRRHCTKPLHRLHSRCPSRMRSTLMRSSARIWAGRA